MVDLNKIKFDLMAPACQVTIFQTDGQIIQSCDTLLKTNKDNSIFDQFDFLKSLEEVFIHLPEDEKLEFTTVEWEEQVNSLFSISFEKINESQVQWIIQDKSFTKKALQSVQQERNNATINEEVLEIQQRYLQIEKELLNFRNAELNRVQKFKEQFFAEVSHEMRTPLNSISGLVTLLQEQHKGDTNQELLSVLQSTSNHLKSIINDVLDLSKIEAGKLKLDVYPFDLKQELANMATGFSVMAKEKGLKFNLSINSPFPKTVGGDLVRISQVIYNLLGNAIKFTEKGEVNFYVHAAPDERDCHQITFKIEDTGKGMSEEEVLKVLEPYAQVEGQGSNQLGGTGLGMGIAYQLVELMGGQLSIKSKVGDGTRISFTLLLDSTEKMEATNELLQELDNIGDLSHLKVLIAEDDETNLLILKSVVDKHGMQATFVSDVSGLEKEIRGHKYNAIVSDINLSGGSALNVFIKLHETGFPSLMDPIIFLSGDSEENHPELDQINNGYFLMKPIEMRELVSLLVQTTNPLKVDLSNLKMSTQNDVELMKDLLDTIIKTLPIELNKLKGFIKADNFEQAAKVLHKINPSVSYLGSDELIELRAELHNAVSANEDVKNRVNTFKSLASRAMISLVIEKDSL